MSCSKGSFEQEIGTGEPDASRVFIVHYYTARRTMNVTVWLPVVFLLGLATMGLLFAFLEACEKV